MEEMIIWESKLDGVYDVKVIRETSIKGFLVIDKGSNRIYSKEVYLSYGATFGPDMEDVALWQNQAANFIDNEYGK